MATWPSVRPAAGGGSVTGANGVLAMDNDHVLGFGLTCWHDCILQITRSTLRIAIMVPSSAKVGV